MKFSTIASILPFSAIASAATTNITLWVNSDDSSIAGKGLASIHEGAAINYYFLRSGAETLHYDSSTGYITADFISGTPFSFQIDDHLVENFPGPDETTSYTFEDDILNINGSSSGFYACKNTGDPYRYSQSAYQALYYEESSDAPADCIPFTIEKQDASSVGSASASSSIPATASATYNTTAPIATSTVEYVATTTAQNSSSPVVTPINGASYLGRSTASLIGAIALALFAL